MFGKKLKAPKKNKKKPKPVTAKEVRQIQYDPAAQGKGHKKK